MQGPGRCGLKELHGHLELAVLGHHLLQILPACTSPMGTYADTRWMWGHAVLPTVQTARAKTNHIWEVPFQPPPLAYLLSCMHCSVLYFPSCTSQAPDAATCGKWLPHAFPTPWRSQRTFQPRRQLVRVPEVGVGLHLVPVRPLPRLRVSPDTPRRFTVLTEPDEAASATAGQGSHGSLETAFDRA
jgi:hypothetical protein